VEADAETAEFSWSLRTVKDANLFAFCEEDLYGRQPFDIRRVPLAKPSKGLILQIAASSARCSSSFQFVLLNGYCTSLAYEAQLHEFCEVGQDRRVVYARH